MMNVICYEELNEEEILIMMNTVFCSKAELPAATYIGNDEWVGLDGVHYIVED